ncbi:MAG: 4-(cytidine 5'-diphospho)-2-C-methyl-D-erythritol kinase [Pseudomonadota bacterium]
MTDFITTPAPAKINLFLRVTGTRTDGYHNIVTLFQKIALFDIITLEKTNGGIELTCLQNTVPADGRNIVYKAARLFEESTGIPLGVKITIDKKIPVAAGLGGGSSDAASLLKSLQEMYEHPCDEDALLCMAAKVGADVPFFVSAYSTAIGRGKGEELEPVQIPLIWVVIVNPGFPVSTKWVYDNLKLTTVENAFNFSPHDTAVVEQLLHNDLETVSIPEYPVINRIKMRLVSCGAKGALMTGSGPTVFSVFEEESKARKVYEELQPESTWSVYLARSL